MTYRMMGGCLGAAWDGPHRAAYASPAVGGPSHVQAFAWGVAGTRPPPLGRRSPSPVALRLAERTTGETCVRVPASSSNYHEKEDDSHEPRRFHRHVQGRHRPAGGGVLPAALPALGERRHAPQAAPQAPGGAGRRHTGSGPLAQGPPGHHRRRRDGHRQDLHRRRRRTSGGLQAGPGPLPAPPGAQVEAGGGDDGARRTRRHRQVLHRPGAAAPLRRLRPPVRGDEP